MSRETRIVKLRGVKLEIEFDYVPEERMVMYYPDMSGHPGSPAEVHINTIRLVDDDDITELLDEDTITRLEEAIHENYE
jgi:hypothetical protein